MSLNAETQQLFNQWVSKWGVTDHPNDEDCFNYFALSYCKDINNCMSKEEFVKMVKMYTHTSMYNNRGIAQKYFRRLEAIVSFCKSNKIS